MSSPWYQHRDNVISLAEWLDGNCAFTDTASVVRFFEKPWKWTYEFALFKFYTDDVYWSGREQHRDRVIDAMIEEKSIEQVKAEVEELIREERRQQCKTTE
jgi:hypothetical protein